MTRPSFSPHNHRACIHSAISTAEAHCAASDLRLTPVRRRVLEILLSEHKAMGAYDILTILKEEGLGGQPPVVYRALDFLLENRLAHKVERLNAYVACAAPGEAHAPTLLICKSCERIDEAAAPRVAKSLETHAQKEGFVVENAVLEAVGLCPECQGAEHAAD